MLEARLAQAVGKDYTIEGEIGRGGMGVVYRARDERLKRPVAIKVLPPELAFRSDIRTRFLREAETAARLSHPHIVPIHTVGDAAELVYFVMAYVDGESLAVRLKRRGKLSIEEARRVAKETADALAAAHQQGVIHRDVKPDNILLEGTRGRVIVTDFGIAKALSAEGGTLTEAGVAIGTPAYMSPEQAAGDREIDGRSDLYSLGVVSYQMLTGELPFQAPSVAALLMKQIGERPAPVDRRRPEVPPELSQIIMRCLEKDPEDRWPTADALRRALETNTYTAPPVRAGRSPRRVSGATGEDSPPPPAPRSPVERLPRSSKDVRRLERRLERSERHERKLSDKEREEREIAELAAKTGEPIMVTRFRARAATYAAVNGMLILINAFGDFSPPWSLIVAGFWGIGVAKDYAKLWMAGYSWRDVIERPPAPDAVVVRTGAVSAAVGRRRDLPPPTDAEFGANAAALSQAQADRAAVLAMLGRLSKEERKMLPEVEPTVNQLYDRAVELGRTLASLERDIDASALDKIDQRLGELAGEPDSPDRERRLALYQQQRQKLAQLIERRSKLQAQFESCVIAMQNVRFDLLRLKSASITEVLGDLTTATQTAKALSREVDAVIDAAGEVRRLTRQSER
ncbi:MAG TPA: protein kinase [Gemmatimonadales bacterium]|nr:protein kinase [Gemmatimonadales bacterium]